MGQVSLWHNFVLLCFFLLFLSSMLWGTNIHIFQQSRFYLFLFFWKLGKYLYYFWNVPIFNVEPMIVAFSQLHKLYKNDFPSSLQKSPPKIRALWWLTLGRKEGQRIQQVEPVLSEQPEAFPAHLKLRLSPRDLQATGGRRGPHTPVAHWGRPLLQRPATPRGPAVWHLWLTGHDQGRFMRMRAGGRPAAQIFLL